MFYQLTPNFTKLKETKGTVQNLGICALEMSNKNEVDSGILVFPQQTCSFTNTVIYLRCVEGTAKARVVPFIANAGGAASGGGGSSSGGDVETFDNDDINDIFNDKP